MYKYFILAVLLMPLLSAWFPSCMTSAGGDSKVTGRTLECEGGGNGNEFTLDTSCGYFTHVRSLIGQNWSYPEEARRERQEGVVSLEFSINRDGTVGSIEVIETSGFDSLDDGIIQTISNSGPFEPLPKSMNKKSITITGDFRYELKLKG